MEPEACRCHRGPTTAAAAETAAAEAATTQAAGQTRRRRRPPSLPWRRRPKTKATPAAGDRSSIQMAQHVRCDGAGEGRGQSLQWMPAAPIVRQRRRGCCRRGWHHRRRASAVGAEAEGEATRVTSRESLRLCSGSSSSHCLLLEGEEGVGSYLRRRIALHANVDGDVHLDAHITSRPPGPVAGVVIAAREGRRRAWRQRRPRGGGRGRGSSGCRPRLAVAALRVFEIVALVGAAGLVANAVGGKVL
mmetsp:Transcript_31306/g.79177  ORF Transcript_31306/g.79177 Transcript_31306/m.79177 type:complete len:247 (+) Transcript_31306:727-1467(+)